MPALAVMNHAEVCPEDIALIDAGSGRSVSYGELNLDGGLGLVKVALLRFLKIHIFANTTMPLHDHVRKKIGWSNTQTVFRFAIIQIVISIATVYMILI